MDDLATSMPEGMEYMVPYDTSPFVAVSIEKVLHTLLEAMVLVFLVMLLFLQKIRLYIDPRHRRPDRPRWHPRGDVCLGLLRSMCLTMFGMVLAIGIIVDDAIVVVENVERIMATEGLPPKEATRKAMKQITGAVIGITLVLTAVFIPMGMASGAVGEIYRQFHHVDGRLDPVLRLPCPVIDTGALRHAAQADRQGIITRTRGGFFGLFNNFIDRATNFYGKTVGVLLRRNFHDAGALCRDCRRTWLQLRPAADIPSCRQKIRGAFITLYTLPSEATTERTREIVTMYEDHAHSREATRKTSLPFSASVSAVPAPTRPSPSPP